MTELLIACRDCGAIQHMRPPRHGRSECWRCSRVLENRNGRSLDAGLACSITTFLLWFPANILPLVSIHVAGITASTHLASGLSTAWGQGWPLLSVTLGTVGIALPFVRFGVLSLTLALIRFGVRDRRVAAMFRICERLDPWAMSDVLLIGAGIGYGRIASAIPVTIETGGWCFVAGAVMTMLTRATLERRAVWRMLEMAPSREPPNALACLACDLVLPPECEGRHCPRCEAKVHRRRPNSQTITGALLLATAILTPIAYGYPMSELWEAGTAHPHTVINGIEMLFNSPFWYFGIIIFFVSLVFPLTKLAVLSWCLLSIHNHSDWRLRTKTKLYRFIDEAGRWSMLDPFTVLVFAPVGQFGQLAHVDFMGGAVAFCATVVLSMLAAHSFDCRLMWDAGEKTEVAAAKDLATQRS